nr:hypothetical protein [Tanacetum cinerariifolium]
MAGKGYKYMCLWAPKCAMEWANMWTFDSLILVFVLQVVIFELSLRSSSIGDILLIFVVEYCLLGFAAALAVLKLERLKVDNARMCEEASIMEYYPNEIILDDLLALDSIVRFGLSDRRLEQTATFSISTNSDSSSSSTFFLFLCMLNDGEMITLSSGIKSQDGSESRPPMLNKENYVPWLSRLLRYDKSRPNGKLIHNSIINVPYTDDELTEKELKQIEADDQTIQTILLILSKDIYAAVDSCKTAQEIWLRVQQMMKGSDIGIQEKNAKLFNEWERFTSNEGESIESDDHRFQKLMNDLKRNKHFPEKIASNLKFLNNLQPEWSRHVTIIHQTKDLHTTDYTKLYDFLKYNQKEVDELKAERLAKIQDPLALMANSDNPYAFPAPHQDQPSLNQNYMQQTMPNPEGITDPTTAMNIALALMAKAFKHNYLTPTNNNQRISSNPRNRQIAQPGMNMGQDRQMQIVGGNGGNQFRQYARQNAGNLTGYNDVQNIRNQNQIRNGNLVAARAEGNAAWQNGNQIRCYNYRGVGHYARNCTYSELLEPIPEQHQVPQNDNNVISEVTSVEQSGEIVEQHPINFEETHALYDSLYQNLAIEVEKVNLVNRKLKETNADLTTELARFKNQEKYFEISQEKYDKLERCYQQSVYQEQCLSKKINALDLSTGKQIMTLNEQISDLNKHLSKEKSIVSFLLEEKKKLKSDFKTREDELLNKQIQLERKIKELNNILVKMGQLIQTIHMLSPKPD